MLQSNFQLITFNITVAGDVYSIGVNQTLYVKYIEDIQAATKRMEIQITDTQSGICSKLRGMEQVFLEIADHEDNLIGGYYVIYDIQDRVQDGGSSKATLMLCTPDFINNAAIKLSRRFGVGDGVTIDKIIREEILQNVLGTGVIIAEENFEKTFNKYSFVSPFWCPFTIISWLAAKSIPVKGSGASASAGYAFFENKFGYNFKSYDKFSSDPVVKTITVGNEVKELEETDEKDVISVDKIRVKSASDVLKGLNIGSYSSNVMTVDLYDMNYENIKFNINKYYDGVELLNKGKKPEYFKNFDKDTSSTRIMSKIIDTALFTEGTHTDGLTKQLSQASLREKLFYNKFVEVDYIGKFDLTVGDVIQLNTFKGKNRDFDEDNSGKYVVAKIERTFYSGDDRMGTSLTLVTDSPGS